MSGERGGCGGRQTYAKTGVYNIVEEGEGMDADNTKNKINTSTLMKRLFKTSRLKAFMKTYNDEFVKTTFREYIQRLCAERDLISEHVIKNSGIDRTYGHQLFSGLRQPSRDKVIQLAFGFSLNVNETQELLRIAGKSLLYPRIKRDAVIMYCLKNSVSFYDAQATLEEFVLPLIGKEGRYE